MGVAELTARSDKHWRLLCDAHPSLVTISWSRTEPWPGGVFVTGNLIVLEGRGPWAFNCRTTTTKRCHITTVSMDLRFLHLLFLLLDVVTFLPPCGSFLAVTEVARPAPTRRFFHMVAWVNGE